MNHYNQRKEPTFGEPSASELDKVTVENGVQTHSEIESEKVESMAFSAPKTAKLALSLHTKTSPGHTFTPVMKRPAQSAKVLSTLEEQAEQTMTNTQSSQQPSQPSTPTATKAQNGGFAFAPVVEDAASPTAAEQPKSVQSAAVESAAQTQAAPAANPVERVIPMASPAAAKAAVEKVPSKYRRLLIVLLLLLAIVVAIILLKPKSPDAVENLQQGSSLPIEFRPVDEEEAKRAEAEAKALQEAQAEQQRLAALQAEQEKAQQLAAQQAPQTQQNVQLPSAQLQSAQTAPEASQLETVASASAVETPKQEAVAVKPVQVQVVKKPETQSSVIHSPETAAKPAKPPVKVEVVKPVVPAKPEFKVTQPAPKAAPKAEPAKAEPALVSVSTKTMTVPKGVSLMQVFRNHNLNISDVNAMSKANNIVSNLKVGEKVTVRLDKNNRVTEMVIGSGGRFIRQPNGTYIYR